MKKIKQTMYNKYLFTLLIIPFLQPLIVNTIEPLDKIYLVLKIICAIIILLLFIMRGKFTKLIIAIATYCVLLCVSTLLNSGEIVRCFSYIVPIASLVMLCDMWMDLDSKSFFKNISVVFSIYILFNLITVISSSLLYDKLYLQHNMNKLYFLGEDNRFIFVILPLIYFLLVNPTFGKKKSIRYLIYCICLFTLIYVWSVGAMVCTLFFGIMYYLFVIKKIKIRTFLNSLTVFLFILASNISLIIFKCYNLFTDLFKNLFNKSQTLESRYMLWDRGVSYIKQKPIFGYGIEKIEILKDKFIVNHTHNALLQIIYESGFLGFLIFLIILFIILKSINGCSNEKIKYTSLISIFIMFLLGLFDSLNHAYFFLMLYSIYKISDINNNNLIVD